MKKISILILSLAIISFITNATNNTSDVIPYFPKISISEQDNAKFAQTIRKNKMYLIIKDKSSKKTTWFSAKLPKPKHRRIDFTGFVSQDKYGQPGLKIIKRFEELTNREELEINNFPDFKIYEDNNYIMGYTIYKNKAYLVHKNKKNKQLTLFATTIKKPLYRQRDYPSGLRSSSPVKALDKEINDTLKRKNF